MVKFIFFLILFSLGMKMHSQENARVYSFADTSGVLFHNVNFEIEEFRGKNAIRLKASRVADNVDKLVLLPGRDFTNATIEFDLTAVPTMGSRPDIRGFAGMAFRVNRDSLDSYEAFYLRFSNGRAMDQTQRNHSTQYISHPQYTWNRLRKDFPAKYESYVDLVPGEWAHIKIEIKGTQAFLYVNNSSQPVLMVHDLFKGASRSGALALWLGPMTDAWFANLSVYHIE